MPTSVNISASPAFEPFLALSDMANTDGMSLTGAFWLELAGLAVDRADRPALADLPAILAALPPEDIAGVGMTDAQRQRAIAELGTFLEVFAPRWTASQDAYGMAAERLRDRILAGGDLGASLGFGIELDPRRRGLRGGAGMPRLAPARIAAIEIFPSAFNRRHFWHLGTAQGGKHRIYLPCHDAMLADRMAPAVRPESAPAVIAAVSGAERPHEIAGIFRALGDASRWAIAQLIARETLSAAEIGRRLGLSPPAMSYHLAELRRAGLVLERTDGAARRISIDPAAFAELGARSLHHLRAAPLPQLLPRSRRKSI
jgi:DNA-binding transcriptional ArsR family regulator